MEFWDRVEQAVRQENTSWRWVASQVETAETTISGWRKKNVLPRVDDAYKIANALHTTIEYLITGDESIRLPRKLDPAIASSGWILRDEKGREIPIFGDIVFIPIYDQRVSAGPGQEIISSADVIGQLPFLKRMLRGAPPNKARALEVRGDSMTGIQIFDGDMVVFIPGEIRGDGIYVLRVGDELIVKRVEFDSISRKIRIMSENPRYPDRVESADGQTVEVVGKVYGWVHAHPY